MEVELHRGIWITGKVTDKKTGHPIEGVPLHYIPFLENNFAQNTPEFGPNRSVLVVARDRYKTKSDGSYRLVGLPGRAIVGVASSDRVPYRFGYGSEAIKGMDERGSFATWWNPFPAGTAWLLSMKEVIPSEGTEAVHVDLELDPGSSVRVRVVDPGGKPLPGTSVIRRMSTSNGETMPQAEFDVVALGPGEDRVVLVQHEGRKLGKAVRIRPGDDAAGPVTVTLEPLATIVGRVADADGEPISGATVQAQLLPFGTNHPSLARVATGSDGRFRVSDVPSGGDYSLMILSGTNLGARQRVTAQAKVRPGETTDVGEVRFQRNPVKRTQEQSAVEGPQTVTKDVPINGRIVDLEGRPVAGVSVKTGSYRTPKSGDLTRWLDGVKRGEPPWVVAAHVEWSKEAPATAMHEATTDRDGRFRLEGLGAERVVQLTLQGATVAATTIEVATRKMDPITARGFGNQHGPGFLSIYGADFTLTAAPGRTVEGIIKDARTGEPVVDAEVRSYRFAGSDWVGTTTVRTKTDAQGRFRLAGMPKGKGNRIIVVPNDEQPYLLQEVAVPDPPGVGPVSVEVSVPRGTLDRRDGHGESDRQAGLRRLAALHRVPGEHVRPGAPVVPRWQQRQRRHPGPLSDPARW